MTCVLVNLLVQEFTLIIIFLLYTRNYTKVLKLTIKTIQDLLSRLVCFAPLINQVRRVISHLRLLNMTPYLSPKIHYDFPCLLRLESNWNLIKLIRSDRNSIQ